MQNGFERYLAVCCNGEVQNITAYGRVSAEFAERHHEHAIRFVHQTSRDGKDWPSIDGNAELERAVIEAAIEWEAAPDPRAGDFADEALAKAVKALISAREKQQ